MSRRQWYYFEAKVVTRFLIPDSPCYNAQYDGPLTGVRKEHWDIALKFAAKIDVVRAEVLANLSYQFDPNDQYDDIIKCSNDDLNSTIDFLEVLKTEFSQNFVPQLEPTEDVPEVFESDEYVRMVNAVTAVLKESRKRRLPYRA